MTNLIQEIYIKNFAIIEEVQCTFEKGMTVLTGETGAGKSIIIDAVGLLIGERASLEMIRYGEEKSLIQGVFRIEEPAVVEKLQEFGVEVVEDELMIQRELLQNGKSNCRINGQLATVALLKQIGPYLIDIHGQNEHFLLLNEEKHLGLLDEFAHHQMGDLIAEYDEAYAKVVAAKQELRALQTAEKEDAQRVDLLKFQLQEIEEANIYVGEEEQLSEEKEYFTHFQKIQMALQTALAALEGEEYSSVDAIGEATREVESLESISTSFKTLSTQMSEAYYQLQDAASAIRHEIENAEFDEERLAFIEERLDVYYQLKRKYGDDAEEILAFQDKARDALNKIENKEALIAETEKVLKKATLEAFRIAEKISSIRREVAKRLEADIVSELHGLYMENAQFAIQFETSDSLLETGIDIVEFYISTNKGEPLKPLSKIVSGGELSRITLAMKSIFTKEQLVGTIIFDEVDTGVSGRVAQAIASKMHYISEYAQVLSITHLPQVASMADTHIHIEKVEEGERTHTILKVMDETERTEEIARMLSGTTITALTLENAKELLQISNAIKQENDTRAEGERK
ncbi:DNA repair protein RecN [Granulicatella adiacens]|uniref:DNA repair protein RecN n=1 Tax=Granulicatella adiacens TaxID=46124 RepID=UPI00352EB10C